MMPAPDYSFENSARMGLTGKHFDLKMCNLSTPMEERSGLDPEGAAEVLRLMDQKQVSFDEARLMLTQHRMLMQGGIDSLTGMPTDPKAFTFGCPSPQPPPSRPGGTGRGPGARHSSPSPPAPPPGGTPSPVWPGSSSSARSPRTTLKDTSIFQQTKNENSVVFFGGPAEGASHVAGEWRGRGTRTTTIDGPDRSAQESRGDSDGEVVSTSPSPARLGTSTTVERKRSLPLAAPVGPLPNRIGRPSEQHLQQQETLDEETSGSELDLELGAITLSHIGQLLEIPAWDPVAPKKRAQRKYGVLLLQLGGIVMIALYVASVFFNFGKPLTSLSQETMSNEDPKSGSTLSMISNKLT